MFPHQTPSRSLYLHLFPAVNGSPPPPQPSPLSPGEDCWANSRRCSQEPGQAHTTKPDLWRNIKHQEVCQHRQLIAANGGRGRRVVGGGVDSKQTQQIQISVPTQLEGSVEAVYVAAMLEGRKQGACCGSYLLTVDSRTSTNNLYSIINNTAWANPL